MGWTELPFEDGKEVDTRNWDLEDDIQNELSPEEFELLVSDTWEDIKGCSTELTQGSRDGGVDVIAEFRGLKSSGISPFNFDKIVIQAKRYNSSIPMSEIERMEGVRRRHNADQAVFVTASEYTDPAETAAEDLEIEYVDGDELVKMLNKSSLNPEAWIRSIRIVDKAREFHGLK
ncbi:restriction endonuclease [Halorientalis marina]|uniref:restriction endonuclease n=1 Tax=Halorientalis marina TaxID=2931976 RepID=UPI001FF29598|nr:restriction endonuclease [Halorientalis marina]